MNFKDFLGDITNSRRSNQEGNETRQDHSKMTSNEMKKHEEELVKTLKLLDKFELLQLEDLCKAFCGKSPTPKTFYDHVTNITYPTHLYRKDYVKFILCEIKFSQVKQFALKENIVSEIFFIKELNE